MRRRGGLAQSILRPGSAPAPAAFAPTDIAGMRVWGKASSFVGANNDPVSTLPDSSGGGYTFTAAGGEEPTYKTNVENGKPGILFAGAQRLRNANVPAQGTGAFSFYIVVKPAAFADYQNLWTLGSADLNKACFAVLNTAGLEYGLYGGAFLVSGNNLDTNGPWVVLCRYDGTTFYSYLNGVATTDPSTTAPGFDLDANGLSIGAGTGFGQFFQGHVFEWGMYDGCITAADVTALQTYLATEYAI